MPDEYPNQKDGASSAHQVAAKLIANVTHELKTPLHSIIAVASVLRSEIDGTLSDEQKRQVDIILRNGETLLELINNLLSFSSVETSSRLLRFTRCDVVSLCSNVVTTVQSLAVNNNVRFVSDYASLPRKFATEPFLLRQVLSNLLSNAVKFSSDGEVVFYATLLSDGSLRFQIGDTGIGMSAEVQASVFDEFYQADSGDAKRYQGVGLGLSLVKTSVALLGGKVQVQSELGRGSLFTVVLPEASERIAQKRVMLVNKDSGIQLSLEEALRQDGYVLSIVTQVSDVSNSIAQITSAQGGAPDLVIIDLEEPVEEVFSLVKMLKLGGAEGSIPVILMSSFDSPSLRAASFEYGANDYIVKPFDIAELMARIRMQVR